MPSAPPSKSGTRPPCRRLFPPRYDRPAGGSTVSRRHDRLASGSATSCRGLLEAATWFMKLPSLADLLFEAGRGLAAAVATADFQSINASSFQDCLKGTEVLEAYQKGIEKCPQLCPPLCIEVSLEEPPYGGDPDRVGCRQLSLLGCCLLGWPLLRTTYYGDSIWLCKGLL